MGADKALLPFKDETLLAHMQNILNDTAADEVRVSRNGAPPDNYVQDLIPHRGPLSGIHAAAVLFPLYDILAVPVDIPLIEAQSLNALILAGQTQSKNARFTASTSAANKLKKAHNLPLFMLNTQEFRQNLTSLLTNTQSSSVYSFVSQFDLQEIPIDNDLELSNINTPSDFDSLRSYKHSADPR